MKVRRIGMMVGTGCAVVAVWATTGRSVDESEAPSAPAPATKAVTASEVDDARLKAADADKNNWLLHGRTYSEQRFSPLDQINAKNADKLRLVWSYALLSNRGVEATPIVVDGVMYVTAPWSIVFALDGKTGKEIWKYDPKVPKEKGRDACCDVVNRGVAFYKGKVYFGALDGRLIALDAATGKVVWEKQTTDPKKPYTITGAPRVVNGKIVIGNGGSEFGVRGYISAYDAEGGELAWRTFTVPGDPSQPHESEELEEAAKTWKGSDEWLKRGAGGTVWDAITYDPELGLVYFGTGNGVAWDRDTRSPEGGDNKYLTSVLAVFADTGRVKWSYQLVPGDTWDFDAAQQLMLADLKIGGKQRKVLMQAPKVGFFYIWDRETGELLSAKKYADKVTWAEKIDLKTGRPVEGKDQRYAGTSVSTVYPSPFGAHNWHPMSYSPKTGLVYIPAQESPGAFEKAKDFKAQDGAWNLGINLANFKGLDRTIVSGHLLAWDPVQGKEVWRAQYRLINNGGTLATAGNLVFQGTADGRFIAYSADKGEKLWEAPAGTGIIAGPVTYMVDGVQYVTIAAGWGGAIALIGGDAAKAAGVKSIGRVLTFAVQGEPTSLPADPEVVRGEVVYHDHCAVCHGAGAIAGGVLPDLRYSNDGVQKVFPNIVKNGIPGTGMAGFAHVVSDEDVKALQKYIQQRKKDELSGL